MKCAWCSKPLRAWQSTKPLGCGYLTETFGQREHTKCSDARRKMLKEGNSRKALLKAAARLNEKWSSLAER